MDFDDSADDEVADFGGVACAEGANGEELVGFEEGAGYGGGYGAGGWREICAMSPVKAGLARPSRSADAKVSRVRGKHVERQSGNEPFRTSSIGGRL